MERGPKLLRLARPGQRRIDREELLDFVSAFNGRYKSPAADIAPNVAELVVLPGATMHLGRPVQAAEMLSTLDLPRRIEDDTELSASEKSLAYAILAEVWIMNADLVKAHEAARNAVFYAPNAHTPEGKHARAQMAAVLALSGEIMMAQRYLETQIDDRPVTTLDDFRDWSRQLATLVVRSRQDGPALGQELAQTHIPTHRRSFRVVLHLP